MKTKNILVPVIAFGLLAQMSSCALLFSGTRDKISVANGTPANAKVYHNGSYVGTAPCAVKISKGGLRKGQSTISIQADGYASQETRFTKRIKMGAVVGDILFTGGIGLIPDFATAAIYKASPSSVNYVLAPVAGYNGNALGFKSGDIVIFSTEKYKNQEGEIVALYPDRALIKFSRKLGTIEAKTSGKTEKEEQVEVPLTQIAKK